MSSSNHHEIEFRARGSESESAGSRTTNSSREGSRASKRELIRRSMDCQEASCTRTATGKDTKGTPTV